jgi:hypothetical protein
MTRFALYGLLTSFFQNDHSRRRLRSARQPSSRLWLLPWHVPPIGFRSHRDGALDGRKIPMLPLNRMQRKRNPKQPVLLLLREATITPAERARRTEMLNRIGSGER